MISWSLLSERNLTISGSDLFHTSVLLSGKLSLHVSSAICHFQLLSVPSCRSQVSHKSVISIHFSVMYEAYTLLDYPFLFYFLKFGASVLTAFLHMVDLFNLIQFSLLLFGSSLFFLCIFLCVVTMLLLHILILGEFMIEVFYPFCI